MKKILMVTVFMLAALSWAAAQQSGSMSGGSSGQTTSSSSQAQGANSSSASQSSQAPSTNSGSAGQSSQVPSGSAGQSSQMPSGNAGQSGAQPGAQGVGQPAAGQNQIANAPITQGCLGGTNPNFTITDTAGTTYKLNIPPDANTSALSPHVGEPVQVLGEVKGAGGTSSIDVTKIGRGTGKCPAGSSGQATPK